VVDESPIAAKLYDLHLRALEEEGLINGKEL
jgi:hypothetical protein